MEKAVSPWENVSFQETQTAVSCCLGQVEMGGVAVVTLFTRTHCIQQDDFVRRKRIENNVGNIHIMNSSTITLLEEPRLLEEYEKTEMFDVEFARELKSHPDICRDDKLRITRYLKKCENVNHVKVSYKLGKKVRDVANVGRLCAENGMSLQSFPRDQRAALAQRYYWDVDIVNAVPTLILQYCERQGFECGALKRYVECREEILDEVMRQVGIERWEAKQRIVALYNGGSSEGLTPYIVRDLAPEARRIVENVWKTNTEMLKWIKKEPNYMGRGMSFFFQTEERKVLLAMDRALAKRGRSLDVLIHDGGLVRKKEGETEFPSRILKEVETDLKTETGYSIRLAVKPMETTIEREGGEDGLIPADVLVDDSYAAKTFVSLMEGKIVLDGCVWVFDDNTGIWTSEDNSLHRKMVEFGEKLVFRQMGPMGPKVFNYSGDVAHQDRLRRSLPAVLPDRRGYFFDRIETSVNHLLFADGIYNFETHTFTKGFDPAIIFFGAVPRPFPAERNEEAIEFVRTKFFRDPFKNPAVGDALIHFLARGVAGHYEAKKVVVAYGPENSTKGSLTKHLETTFGKGLIGTFHGDSLLMRTGDVEATKSLSWVKKFCDKRIAYSSEISISKEKPKPINGNLLKSLSGGGDTITLRTNHKDEEEVVNKALTFVFVNDLPDISPVDGSIRDRLVTIPYSYSFVDEPTLPYQRARDHTISAVLKTDMYRDATVWLLVDAIKSWNGKPYVLPEECSALKNDLAPMSDIQELLAEEYDLTGNPEDWVATEELVSYLRSKKVDGSDRKIGDKLTQIGLETTVRREGRRTVRGRVGIRRAD